MSLAYNKQKGREWENAIVDYFLRNGVPYAERRRLAGVLDKGDIAGIPGIVIEAKNEKTYKPAAWLKEAEVERVNAAAELAFVWARINGKPRAEDGVWMMSPASGLLLLREAGYVRGGP